MKAMILAAGRGTRMGALTDSVPKALLQAGGKPLIAWQVEKLAAAGITELVINTAHLGEMIESALGDRTSNDVVIRYSHESPALETAGGIAWALPLLGTEPFVIVNADAFSDFDFVGLRRRVLTPEALAHLILVNNPAHHPDGDFALDNGRLSNALTARLTYSGIGVYRPEMFHGIARGDKVALGPMLRQAIDLQRVTGELHSGYWLDVGSPERLQTLHQHLQQRRL
jgi:N-acetyl-alpha-D-muramate 1-phosphate uridylyltransferase